MITIIFFLHLLSGQALSASLLYLRHRCARWHIFTVMVTVLEYIQVQIPTEIFS